MRESSEPLALVFGESVEETPSQTVAPMKSRSPRTLLLARRHRRTWVADTVDCNPSRPPEPSRARQQAARRPSAKRSQPRSLTVAALRPLAVALLLITQFSFRPDACTPQAQAAAEPPPVAACLFTADARPRPDVTERAPNQEVLQYVWQFTNRAGELELSTNTVVELAAGLNRYDPQSGGHVPCRAESELTRDGYCLARQTQYQERCCRKSKFPRTCWPRRASPPSKPFVKTLTTYPPFVRTNPFALDVVLGPTARRDKATIWPTRSLATQAGSTA